MNTPTTPTTPSDIAAITANGERVIHLRPDSSYYAHLSLYRFALPWCQGKRVLDAGSGTGYGAAYLARSGARSVNGIDSSSTAVAFSRETFPHNNLYFHCMDLMNLAEVMDAANPMDPIGLEAACSFADQTFDVIFSSNTLEHIAHVPAFLQSAWRLLQRDGVLIVAVPPITSDMLRGLNIDNPYHLNIWTPRQWYHVLADYFATIDIYGHGYGRMGTTPDWSQPPEQTGLTEASFVFERLALDDLHYTPGATSEPTITAIFVAHTPRNASELPDLASVPTFVDQSFTRSPSEAAIQLRLKQQVGALEAALSIHSQHVALIEARLAQQQQQTAALEATLQQKNEHILHLEEVIRRLESGRVMRLLRWLQPQPREENQ